MSDAARYASGLGLHRRDRIVPDQRHQRTDED
jgi:hypothetical protein